MSNWEWSGAKRTTFMEYLFNDSSGIVNGMPFSRNLFFARKEIVKPNKHSSKLYFMLSYWLQTRQSPLKGSYPQFVGFFCAVLSSTLQSLLGIIRTERGVGFLIHFPPPIEISLECISSISRNQDRRTLNARYRRIMDRWEAASSASGRSPSPSLLSGSSSFSLSAAARSFWDLVN